MLEEDDEFEFGYQYNGTELRFTPIWYVWFDDGSDHDDGRELAEMERRERITARAA